MAITTVGLSICTVSLAASDIFILYRLTEYFNLSSRYLASTPFLCCYPNIAHRSLPIKRTGEKSFVFVILRTT